MNERFGLTTKDAGERVCCSCPSWLIQVKAGDHASFDISEDNVGDVGVGVVSSGLSHEIKTALQLLVQQYKHTRPLGRESVEKPQ